MMAFVPTSTLDPITSVFAKLHLKDRTVRNEVRKLKYLKCNYTHITHVKDAQNLRTYYEHIPDTEERPISLILDTAQSYSNNLFLS